MPFNSPSLHTSLSQKLDGSMKLELANLGSKIVENRKKYFLQNNINPKDVVSAEIVHGKEIKVVKNEDKWKIISWVDWLITNEANLYLSVTFADCVPIYFYDDIKKVIWIAHAGWRWITSDITKSMIESFLNNFGSNTSDIKAYIWPHIQKCHFEIKDDIIANFPDKFVSRQDWTLKVDLLWIIQDKLENLWIKKQNISSSDECTYCESDQYFSYRRDKPQKVEVMIGVIERKS